MNMGDLANGNGRAMEYITRMRQRGAGPITSVGPQATPFPPNGHPPKGPNDLPRYVPPIGSERPPSQRPQFPGTWNAGIGGSGRQLDPATLRGGMPPGIRSFDPIDVAGGGGGEEPPMWSGPYRGGRSPESGPMSGWNPSQAMQLLMQLMGRRGG